MKTTHQVITRWEAHVFGRFEGRTTLRTLNLPLHTSPWYPKAHLPKFGLPASQIVYCEAQF
jgi:hypothetical protein